MQGDHFDYRELFMATRDAIMLLDPSSGQFLTANPSALKMFGAASIEQFLALKPWEHSPKRQPDGSLSLEKARAFIAAAKNGAPQLFEWTHQLLNGAMFPAEVLLTPIMQEDKILIYATVRDISDRYAAITSLKESFKLTIGVIATAIEKRDAYTAGHQRRVAVLARRIAFELGLTSSQIEGLSLAASIHDVGKICVPAEILSKPSGLSPLEYQLIQTHVQAGFDIIKDIKFPWPLGQIILQHHERLDGSGYPNSLRSDAILFEAKILAVADVVETMLSHRPYRPALGLDVTLDEIRNGKGLLYDETVADVCISLFTEKGFVFE